MTRKIELEAGTLNFLETVKVRIADNGSSKNSRQIPKN
jgi:hypothetical protein